MLIVDDDRLIRTLLRQLLEALGYDVDEAETSRDASVRLGAAVYRLALVDLQLAAGGARDVLESIDRARLPVPVVLMSGTTKSDAATLLNHGNVCHFLEKPFGLAELEEALSSAGLPGSGRTSP